jgi:hypothetical protein
LSGTDKQFSLFLILKLNNLERFRPCQVNLAKEQASKTAHSYSLGSQCHSHAHKNAGLAPNILAYFDDKLKRFSPCQATLAN